MLSWFLLPDTETESLSQTLTFDYKRKEKMRNDVGTDCITWSCVARKSTNFCTGWEMSARGVPTELAF